MCHGTKLTACAGCPPELELPSRHTMDSLGAATLLAAAANPDFLSILDGVDVDADLSPLSWLDSLPSEPPAQALQQGGTNYPCPPAPAASAKLAPSANQHPLQQGVWENKPRALPQQQSGASSQSALPAPQAYAPAPQQQRWAQQTAAARLLAQQQDCAQALQQRPQDPLRASAGSRPETSAQPLGYCPSQQQQALPHRSMTPPQQSRQQQQAEEGPSLAARQEKMALMLRYWQLALARQKGAAAAAAAAPSSNPRGLELPSEPLLQQPQRPEPLAVLRTQEPQIGQARLAQGACSEPQGGEPEGVSRMGGSNGSDAEAQAWSRRQPAQLQAQLPRQQCHVQPRTRALQAVLPATCDLPSPFIAGAEVSLRALRHVRAEIPAHAPAPAPSRSARGGASPLQPQGGEWPWESPKASLPSLQSAPAVPRPPSLHCGPSQAAPSLHSAPAAGGGHSGGSHSGRRPGAPDSQGSAGAPLHADDQGSQSRQQAKQALGAEDKAERERERRREIARRNRKRKADYVSELEHQNTFLRQEVGRLQGVLRLWASQGYVSVDQALDFLESAPKKGNGPASGGPGPLMRQ